MSRSSDDTAPGVSGGILATLVLGAIAGALAGSAGYTARSARATSYLSDDPRACINCHIMNDQFNAWSSGPHHARASCNDCHVPHDSVVSKYYVKAEHGYRHSKGFTFNTFHEPIQMTPSSREVVVDNCVRCHEAMTHEIRNAASPASARAGDASQGVDCLHCHSSMGHGPTR
jgi:cytochrome c nitrite reductase small subunit